jgi:hypothetical protein
MMGMMNLPFIIVPFGCLLFYGLATRVQLPDLHIAHQKYVQSSTYHLYKENQAFTLFNE